MVPKSRKQRNIVKELSRLVFIQRPRVDQKKSPYRYWYWSSREDRYIGQMGTVHSLLGDLFWAISSMMAEMDSAAEELAAHDSWIPSFEVTNHGSQQRNIGAESRHVVRIKKEEGRKERHGQNAVYQKILKDHHSPSVSEASEEITGSPAADLRLPICQWCQANSETIRFRKESCWSNLSNVSFEPLNDQKWPVWLSCCRLCSVLKVVTCSEKVWPDNISASLRCTIELGPSVLSWGTFGQTYKMPAYSK